MKRNTELAYAQGCAATRGHLSKLKRTDSFNFENRAQNIFSKITKLGFGRIKELQHILSLFRMTSDLL